MEMRLVCAKGEANKKGRLPTSIPKSCRLLACPPEDPEEPDQWARQARRGREGAHMLHARLSREHGETGSTTNAFEVHTNMSETPRTKGF